MTGDLNGRTALVLGASKGIGYAIAEALTNAGASVAVASRTERSVQDAGKALNASAYVHDSNHPDTAGELVASVERDLGQVSILVLNTGGPPVNDDPLAVPASHFDAAHRSLLLTPIAMLQAVLPSMRAQGWGRVLSVSSTAVREPMTDIVLSGVYRSALAAALKVYSREVAGDGVTINSILPGDIATDRLLDSFPSREAAADDARVGVPVGRLGRPGELASLAAFLCSDAAAFVTGTMIAVDGGRSVAL